MGMKVPATLFIDSSKTSEPHKRPRPRKDVGRGGKEAGAVCYVVMDVWSKQEVANFACTPHIRDSYQSDDVNSALPL